MLEKKQLQIADDPREKFIGDIRNNDTDVPASLCPKPLSVFIQLKAVVLNHSAYTKFRLPRIAPLFEENAGYGCGGHLCKPCDIYNIIFMMLQR